MGLWQNQQLSMRYIVSEVRRSPRSYAIGLFTVFLVVFFVALLQNAVLQSPLIFFKLSENAVGENDLLLTPGLGIKFESETYLFPDTNGVPLLNHSFLSLMTQDTSGVRGGTPRWVLVGSLSELGNALRNASVLLLAMDSEKEKELGIGREWTKPPLTTGECYVSETVIRQIGLDPKDVVGEVVQLSIDLIGAADAAGVVERDDDGNISKEEADRLAELIFPGLSGAWDNRIEVDVLSLVNTSFNFNLSQLNLTSDVDIGELLDGLETFLSPIGINFTFPDGVRDAAENATIPFNFTGTFEEALELAIGNQTLLINTSLAELAGGELADIITNFTFALPLVVADTVGDPNGKWSASFGSVVVMESDDLFDVIREQADTIGGLNFNITALLNSVDLDLTGSDSLDESIEDALEDALTAAIEDTLNISLSNISNPLSGLLTGVNEEDYALISVFMFRSRVDLYIQDLEALMSDMIRLTNNVAREVGVKYEARFETPVNDSLQLTIWLRYFLDNVFGAVIALIVAIGALLIYSLMLNDVEAKTYEYGMLRALGMPNRTLIQLLTSKSITYAIPGVALGLLFAYLINIPISDMIAEFAAVEPRYSFFATAIILGVCIGVLMPLLSNVVPVCRAMSKTLRDSLDVYHHVISDVSVSIVRVRCVVDLFFFFSIFNFFFFLYCMVV